MKKSKLGVLRLSLLALVVLVFVSLIAADCGATTTTASMAFVVGNGQSGSDSSLHRIVYPGQQINQGAGENVSYVPANSRNYIINDGTVKNANGETVGDRFNPIVAYTKSGVKIKIFATAYWTLNQSDAAMRHFYDLSLKYQAASNKDVGGDANYSTKGWNGMLAETFGPVMDRIARTAAEKVDDSIWQKHSQEQYRVLEDGMAIEFPKEMRKVVGYSDVDLFGGSGNSQWSDPKKPGEGTFNNSPVRIRVDDVQIVQDQADQNSQGAITLNEQRLKNAQALYGPDAGFWLGLQDVIDKSKQSNTPLIINLGGGSPVIPMVPITGTNTAPVEPTPSPTPTAEK